MARKLSGSAGFPGQRRDSDICPLPDLEETKRHKAFSLAQYPRSSTRAKADGLEVLTRTQVDGSIWYGFGTMPDRFVDPTPRLARQQPHPGRGRAR